MSPRDTALLSRWIETRDAEAFADLVALYENLVYAAASRVLRSDPDARDVAQECFLRLALKPPKTTEYLGGWLHRVVTNLALDAKRRQSRAIERERNYAQSSAIATEPEWNDLQLIIDQAIDGLSEKTRSMVIAHYLQGQTYAEIAAQTGVSKQAVAGRVAKGIEELRRVLARAGVTLSAAGLVSFLSSHATKAAPVALALTIARIVDSMRTAAPLISKAPQASAALSKLFAAIAAAAALITTTFFVVGNKDSDAVRDPNPVVSTSQPVTEQDAAPAPTNPSVAETPPRILVAQATSSPSSGAWSGSVHDSATGESIKNIPVQIRLRSAIKHTVTQTDKMPNVVGREAQALESIHKDLKLTDPQKTALAAYTYALDLKLSFGPPLTTVASDENGSIVVNGLAPGEYVATVDTPEYATVGRAPFPIEGDGMGVARVVVGTVLRVEPGASAAVSIPIDVQRKSEVIGRVYDYTSGAGIPGVVIQARQRTPNHPIVNVPMAETTTDAQGNFRLSKLWPGDCLLWRSEVENYVSGRALEKAVRLEPGKITEHADFVLSTGGLLAGTLLIGGQPAKNTPFDLLAIQADQDISKNDSITERLLNSPVTTDENGQFFVSGVLNIQGPVLGQVHLDTGQTHHSYAVKAGFDKGAYDEVKLEIPWGPGVINGRLTDETGRPLRGGVVVKFVYGETVGGRSEVSTGADGTFRLDGIEKGRGELWVHYPLSYAAVVVPLDFQENETALNVTIPSKAVTATCSNIPDNVVRLTMKVFEPGWKVDYRGDWRENRMKEKGHYLAQTRWFPREGKCRLLGLVPGTYTIVAISFAADGDSIWYYDDQQMDRYLRESRVVIQQLTVTADNLSPQVNLDFANSVSLYEAGQGATN